MAHKGEERGGQSTETASYSDGGVRMSDIDLSFWRRAEQLCDRTVRVVCPDRDPRHADGSRCFHDW